MSSYCAHQVFNKSIPLGNAITTITTICNIVACESFFWQTLDGSYWQNPTTSNV